MKDNSHLFSYADDDEMRETKPVRCTYIDPWGHQCLSDSKRHGWAHFTILDDSKYVTIMSDR